MGQIKHKRQNWTLTKTIIYLHAKGFTEEFFVKGSDIIHFLTGESIPYFDILLISQAFDELTHSYKYIHAIESDCGVKGLLLMDRCFFRSHCPSAADNFTEGNSF